MASVDVDPVLSDESSSDVDRHTAKVNGDFRGVKTWGSADFWGLGFDFDPVWLYTEEQLTMIKELMEICRVHIRPKAAKVDRDYIFPRAALEVLTKRGYMNLAVPKELGGKGANNVTIALVCETLARYGDPSVAMVYIMHTSAVFFLCCAYKDNPDVQNLLRRLNSECLVGTVAASDPTTGGHFWYFLSAKTQRLADGRIRIHKFVSWVTSAGHADFYVVGAPDPDVPRGPKDVEQAAHTAFFLMFKNEVRANSDSYRGLGLHGNHSGPAICEAVLSKNRLLTGSRMRTADGQRGGDDFTSVYQCLQCSAFMGMALGALDIGKSHVVNKIHADTGQRISEYPIIQDYFGTSLSRVNVCRFCIMSLLAKIDEATRDNDWTLAVDPSFRPRASFTNWSLQLKVVVSQVTDDVTTSMVRACGGAGYTTALGIERLLRDSKAFWLMGPSTEMARKIIGQLILNGCQSVDLFETRCDFNALYHQLNKLNAEQRRIVAEKILTEADRMDGHGPKPFPGQGEDFDNPFNTAPTTYNDLTEYDSNGVSHGPGLHPVMWTKLRLTRKTYMDKHTFLFSFALPRHTDHTGTLPGQHVQVRIAESDGKRDHSRRYYSPISKPDDYGKIDLIVRSECQGAVLAQHMNAMKEGDFLEFRGPSGGFEYYPNSLDYIIAICGGNGVTPAIQIARSIQDNPGDKCRMFLYYANAKPSQILLRDELTKRSTRSDGKLSVKFVVGDASDVRGQGPIVEDFMDEDFFREHFPPDLKSRRHKILVCGGGPMIISVLYALRAMMIPSDSVFIYGATAPEYIKSVYGRAALLSSHKSYEFHSETQDGLCLARMARTDSGGSRILLSNKGVCSGIRLENWSREPKMIREKDGAITIWPTAATS